jgi:hypothetical protein
VDKQGETMMIRKIKYEGIRRFAYWKKNLALARKKNVGE